MCVSRLVKRQRENTALADAFFALGLTKGSVDTSPNATEATALEMAIDLTTSWSVSSLKTASLIVAHRT
jgi:hypothetical protein